MSSPRPKRPKLDDTAYQTTPPTSSAPKYIKSERSSSPSRGPGARQLVTFGVKRFAPLPPNCQSSCPEYKRNRKEWATVCANELVALDLKVVRTMIRDDGLAIDWSSPVPVWSHTLKPEPCDLATAITQTHQANARSHSGYPSPSRARSASPSHGLVDGSPTKRAVPMSMSQPVSGLSRPSDTNGGTQNGKKLPVPPRPSSIRRAIVARSVGSSPSSPSASSQPCGPPGADDDGDVVIFHPPPPLNRPKLPIPVLTAPPTPVPEPSAPDGGLHRTTPDAAAEYTSVAEREMSEMTLDYLRRYVQTYEADRASLASAYSRLASFSYRIHRCGEFLACDGSGSIPRASDRDTSVDSGLQRGRLDIITTLITLPSLHCEVSPSGDTCPSASGGGGVGQLSYDILYLGARLGMFVVCRAVVSTKLVVHSFMLQRREADKEEAGVEGVWPVVANVHQIVVFE